MKQTIKVLGIIAVIVGVMLLASMPTASAKLYGDANGDDVIDEADITYVEQIIAGEEEENELADANQDGVIDLLDVAYIEGIILGDNPFPGGTITAEMIFWKQTVDPAEGWIGWFVRKPGIYETLFANNENMVLTPELATGYEQVSDTEWEISLREDVTFHDGTPFNADAVVYSFERGVLDESNSRHTGYDFIDSVEKKDEYTVTITTKEPYAPLIASLADPVTSIVSPEADDLDTNAVGTGPFKLIDYDPDVEILKLERNDNYWGGQVKLENATMYYSKEPKTRSDMLEGGEVDIARNIPKIEADIIDGKPDLEVISKETMRTYFMYVNTKKAPLDNVKVRQAINYAINRDQIVENPLISGVAAKSVFPSGLPWSANEVLTGYSFNEAKALSLLAEANITDTDGDGWLDYNGEPFELTIKTYTSRPELEPTINLIAEQLKEIGIKASAQTRETGLLKEEVGKDGNYDLALWAWGVAPTGDPDYFLKNHFDSTGKYAGWTGYNNPEVDRLIEEGRTTFDYDTRWDIYKQVQEQILADSPEIFVFYLNELVGLNTRVKGYVIYPNEITFLTKDMYNTA
nr:ABC transporter, solute-binding protein [uncultured archaeon]